MNSWKFGILLLAVITIGCKKDSPSEPLRTTNQKPVINTLLVSSDTIESRSSTEIICVATDMDGDELSYEWSASGGSYSLPRYDPENEFYFRHAIEWRAPSYAGDYKIKVFVSDSREAVSDSLTITVSPENQDPKTPSQPSPREAQIIDLPLTLSWTCSDPENDPLTYRVVVFNDERYAFNGDVDSTSITLTELDSACIYTWRVTAKDNHDNSTTSPTWHFVTK